MNQSILTSIKKLLGIDEENDSFDLDITIHINSVFMILNQIGIGPEEGFAIEDAQDVWGDFIDDLSKLQSIKTYVYLKVRMLFDPPVNSTVKDSINSLISELEWRINFSRESEGSGA